MVCLVGSVWQGNMQLATTVLTAGISDTDTTIPVASTEGFGEPGIIVIGQERIAYSEIDGNNFDQIEVLGIATSPMVRGADDTEAVAHSAGAGVRTIEGSMMNDSVNYNIAVIADSSGVWAGTTIALAILRIMLSFFILPIGFLGTDLAIIGIIWWAMVVGMIISLGISLAGGRRV